MEWMHNIVGGTAFPVDATGIGLTLEPGQGYALWITDARSARVWRLPFNANGNLGRMSIACERLYDAFLPLPQGYALVFYEAAKRRAVIKGYSTGHENLWECALPDADSLHWDLAALDDESLFLLYSSCNPYDAYRQAHVARITPRDKNKVQILFTTPDEDFIHAQLLVPQPERLAACVRSRGAATVVYFIDDKGELLHDGLFAAHPHSRWGVPLCRVPLENGDILMGGYKENDPGRRRAWICRFDADISALNGGIVAEKTEQAVTALLPEASGGVLALCPPWKILRLSSKGFVTHIWQVPEAWRANSITTILSVPDGGCLIAGRSWPAGKYAQAEPAAWLARIGASEFVSI